MDMLNHPLLSSLSSEPPPIPASYPQFQRLDRSVVCPICKEMYSGPVTVACGHSFCSQCIRSSLDAIKDKRCPLCDSSITEGSIRRNRALEEIVDAWDAARPTIITWCQNAQAGPSRRRPPAEAPSRPSSTSSKRARGSSGSESPHKVRRVEDDDILEIPDSGDIQEAQELSENDTGQCPICQVELSIATIPLHIERGCPAPKATTQGSGNQKADWKKVFAGGNTLKEKKIPLERIRKPNYSLTSPGDLRKILNEYSLPTTGDKDVLHWRIQQWIILFNANLDTSHPQSISALRAKLKAAEAARQKDKDKGKEGVIADLGQYAKDKKSDFERLRREIMERDNKRSGVAVETAIEVE